VFNVQQPRPHESFDNNGVPADNDQPYRWGRLPRALSTWPFTERQFARLLILRGRVRAERERGDAGAAA
jgi:hypothetical protein